MIEVAVVVLKTYGNRALLLQRSPEKHYSMQWCYPGGKVEGGEDVFDAALREMVEETGIVIPPNLLEKYCERVLREHKFHYFAVKEVWPVHDVILNKEHIGFGWFNSNEMLHLSMTEPSRYA